MRAGDRQRPELARLHQRQRARHVLDHEGELSGHQVGQRRRAAFIGHVHDVDAGHRFEEFGREVGRAADAARAVVELAGARLGVGDQLLHRLHGHRRVHDQQQRRGIHHRHRREVGERVEGEPGIEVRAHHQCGVAHQQGVAVGFRPGHDLGADDAAGARPVVDHHLLPERCAEMLADQAGHDVEHAGARRERHHDAERAVGIVLRRCSTCFQRRQRARQKEASWQ